MKRFIHLFQSLEDALDAPAPEPSSPDFAAYLDNQLLFQQCALIENLHLSIETNNSDYRAISNLRQTFALIEKSQARRDRKKAKDANAPQQPERDEARNFLEAELAQGERPAKEIFQVARSIGIASATLKRAKACLNITTTLCHHPDRTRCWMWSMPTQAPSDAQHSELSTQHPVSTPTSAPDSPDTSEPARVPSTSVEREDHQPSAIENNAATSNPATPIGPIRPIGPIPAQTSNLAQDPLTPPLSARKT